MSAAAETMMADHERKDVPFQVRCSASWIERVQAAADAIGLSAAAYIRMVVTQRMDSDGVPKVAKPKPKPRRP